MLIPTEVGCVAHQRSADRSWPLFRMISGATYSGVPQKVHVLGEHRVRHRVIETSMIRAADTNLRSNKPRRHGQFLASGAMFSKKSPNFLDLGCLIGSWFWCHDIWHQWRHDIITSLLRFLAKNRVFRLLCPCYWLDCLETRIKQGRDIEHLFDFRLIWFQPKKHRDVMTSWRNFNLTTQKSDLFAFIARSSLPFV